MKIFGILKIVFLLVGGALLGGAYYLHANIREFVDSAHRAQGMVVDLAQSRSSSGNSTLYAPVVRFRTDRGRDVQFTSSVSSSPPSHSVGETVEVLYELDRPEKAEVDSFFSLWFAPIILDSIGSVFFLIGTVFFFASGKKQAAIRASSLPAEPDPKQSIYGLLFKQVYAEVPPRTEYSLTQNGRKLVGIIEQIRVLSDEIRSAEPSAPGDASKRSR